MKIEQFIFEKRKEEKVFMRIKTEKTVYFVRHGQSVANITPVFQPEDSPLSPVGVKQSGKAAIRIASIPFDALIVSNLLRAKQTGEMIAIMTDKQPEHSDLFVERIKPTALSGKAYEDPDAERLYQEWETSLYTSGQRVENGENYDDLVTRSDRAFDLLVKRPEQVIVVVTHGFFLRTLVSRVVLGDAFNPHTFKNFQNGFLSNENTGITILKYGKFKGVRSWRVETYNDHSHLGPVTE